MQALETRTIAPQHQEQDAVTRIALTPPATAAPALHLVGQPSGLPVLLPPDAEAFKRAFDLFVAVLGLVLIAPLLAAIALAIRIDSKGPVLFRQRRIGRNGGAFAMCKFRTMIDGAHDLRYELVHLNEAADGLFKIADDPRVTRVGRILRRTHLDELPQLWNVLAGRMSLVGPRPLVPEEDELIPTHLRHRLAVRPGMTGPWQITCDHRLGLTSMAQLDVDYIARWSAGTDLKLLAATAGRVLTLRGK
jgi:lipopolysaccharide/colanic/teichoic acid biosynthesis glycosyltransferase